MEATAIAIVIILALGAIILALLLYCCAYRSWEKWSWPSSSRSRSCPHRDDLEASKTRTAANMMIEGTMEIFIVGMDNEKPKRFTEEQLDKYTGNYSAQLGSGGFGTVYKGDLPPPNGAAVAVKVFHARHSHETLKRQFMAEIGAISRTNHINLVRLHGFCCSGAKHALVYEYMEHGSLGDYLSSQGAAGVSMDKVAAIATGVAKGLRYLHEECQPKILHLDIKPANVLLDPSLTPKLADFGLARLLNHADTHISVSRAGGTPLYAPPEVALNFDTHLTDKCDVYSFGVLLLSIVGRGRKNWESQGFPKTVWTRYEAGKLKRLVSSRGSEDEQRRRRELVERMCKVAFWCVQRQPPARPSMSEVVKMLEGEKTILPPPNPFQYLDAKAPA